MLLHLRLLVSSGEVHVCLCCFIWKTYLLCQKLSSLQPFQFIVSYANKFKKFQTLYEPPFFYLHSIVEKWKIILNYNTNPRENVSNLLLFLILKGDNRRDLTNLLIQIRDVLNNNFHAISTDESIILNMKRLINNVGVLRIILVMWR